MNRDPAGVLNWEFQSAPRKGLDSPALVLSLLNNKDSFPTSEVKYGSLEYESFISAKNEGKNWKLASEGEKKKKTKQEEEDTLGWRSVFSPSPSHTPTQHALMSLVYRSLLGDLESQFPASSVAYIFCFIFLYFF